MLAGIAAQRDWMCRWQRLLTLLHDAAACGAATPGIVALPSLLARQSHIAIARRGMGDAHARLRHLREELKRHDPHAWGIHTYGLALATEGARGAEMAAFLLEDAIMESGERGGCDAA